MSKDKQQGTPWVTKLPFPVQVVEKVEAIDEISGLSLVTCYSYHHGYYDRIEREFRGFGRVERWDQELERKGQEASHFCKKLNSWSLTGRRGDGETGGNSSDQLLSVKDNLQLWDAPKGPDIVKDDGYTVAPVLTKTWYHTGAWQQSLSLFEKYQQEYFQGDNRAAKMLQPMFEWGEDYQPTPEEVRQANMALKETVLRSEVYGLDGTELEQYPYSVSEAGFNIKLLQPLDENQASEYKNAVFFVWEREAIAYEYERNINDPRIAHNFTVEIDDYGNVLKDCAIAYERRENTDTIPEQNSLKATYSENKFINLLDSSEDNEKFRLLGVPYENKGYELTNISLPDGKDYFDFEAIANLLNLENLNETNTNLLTWERHYYWDQSLQKILQLGEVSNLGLLARSEIAVVSQEHIKSVFSEGDDKVLEETELNILLQDKGEYKEAEGYWWNPGLKQSYLGKDSFYLPSDTTDPFEYVNKVQYDEYKMFAVKVTDAINNEMTVEKIDYQTLQPQKMRDINDNISEVLFDPLGMVIVSYYYGTENGIEVGFKENVNEVILPPFNMEEAIENPEKYLNKAGSYFYYDLFAWKTNKIPVHAVNLMYENYTVDERKEEENNNNEREQRVQISITHSDGFGREVQTKIQVEPGQGFSIKENGELEENKLEQRWLCSGRKLYNQKGNPYKEYEPYYIDTYEYVNNPQLNQFGVSSVLHYDPLDRPIRVDIAKGFFTKVEFTPWWEKHYDENDTVKDSNFYKKHIKDDETVTNLENSSDVQEGISPAERNALKQAAKFHDTPEIKILDNLGRTVREVSL
ncbi:toxin TcdB middle/C-terminal domain-containing protein [Crocosphaera watsonii]|uniref:YD repeat protein n=3 Tax=Crocosphaera watsonii TaxID=263511 RepID=G5J1G4_CROWT|nr:toxin TcdB middle/C-terminal domain-containing protein [Crocosphaera watsonii]EHJ13977.1 YD repeat protein [Crocosphaera watsonii WH 0003]CCQ57553.1 Putative toxin subunit [Crocosphaera watsonii WH 0005]